MNLGRQQTINPPRPKAKSKLSEGLPLRTSRNLHSEFILHSHSLPSELRISDDEMSQSPQSPKTDPPKGQLPGEVANGGAHDAEGALHLGGEPMTTAETMSQVPVLEALMLVNTNILNLRSAFDTFTVQVNDQLARFEQTLTSLSKPTAPQPFPPAQAPTSQGPEKRKKVDEYPPPPATLRSRRSCSSGSRMTKP